MEGVVQGVVQVVFADGALLRVSNGFWSEVLLIVRSRLRSYVMKVLACCAVGLFTAFC